MKWVNTSWLMLVLTCSQNVGSQNVTQVHFQSDGVGSTDSMLDVAVGTLPEMTQFTVCARLYLKQAAEAVNPFTSYVGVKDNEILIGTLFASQVLIVLCCQDISFEVQVPVNLLTWHHTCISLNLETRYYWIAFDDIFEEGNLETNTLEQLKVTGKGRLSIGQELDSLEGLTAIQQSFYGTIAQYQLFSKALNPSYMENYVRCLDTQTNHQPLLSFRNMSAFAIKGSTVVEKTALSKLCQQSQGNHLFTLPEKRTFQESQTSCLSMGGSMALPTNDEENTQIGEEVMKFQENCTSYFQSIYWIGAQWDITTKKWLRLTDGKEITWNKLTEIVGVEDSTCITVGTRSFEYGWVTTNCNFVYFTCPVCNISIHETLTLRGLCENTYLDRSMTIHGYHNHKPLIHGAHYTQIRWSNEFSGWLMTNRKVKNLIGLMKMETPSAYPFGIRTWNITGDKCNVNPVKVLITTCNPETEITCTDGMCISKSQRCNMITDCSDQSDEINCNLIELPLSYATDLPPPKSGDTPLPINMSIEITSVKHIDILAFKIGLDIRIEYRWRDDRLLMKNLMDNNWANKVKHHANLWKPNVQITDGSKSLADVALGSESLMILKEGNHLPDDPSRLIEDMYYSGSENTLLLYQVITTGFTCQFELQRYPFDIQTCSLMFSLLDIPADYATLTQDGDGVVFTGQKRLLEYMVTKVNMTFVNTSDYRGGQMVTIELKNLYGYYISSTYVPTLLLVIICYLTLFFDMEDFTDRVMVSLTSLLVLAALFSQTSQSIPKTSYLKLIDIWFVSIIVMVFHIILLLVIIEGLHLRSQRLRVNNRKKITAVQPVKEKHPFSNVELNFTSPKIPLYKDADFVNSSALIILPIIMVIFLIAYISIIQFQIN